MKGLINGRFCGTIERLVDKRGKWIYKRGSRAIDKDTHKCDRERYYGKYQHEYRA